jgi:hypothetical protein
MFDYSALKEFVKNNPDVPAKEAAEKFGCTLQKVYTARYSVGVSKPITMQKKKGLKVVRKSTLDAKDNRIEELEKELEEWRSGVKTEIRYIATPDQVSAVKHLECQLLDAKAVIAYLEGRLRGTSV